MSAQRNFLDLSPAERIRNPSAAFQEFVEEYFRSPYRWRLEQDSSVLKQFAGDEREAAVDLICRNLRSGETQIIDAAVYMRIDAAIPILQDMLRSARVDWDTFHIARALNKLNALSSEDFYDVCKRIVAHCDRTIAFFLLDATYSMFAPDDAQRLIDIALRRESYDIRAGAYRAAVAVQYIRKHGGRFTSELGHAIWRKSSDAATAGSEQPMFYEQLQYYVGNAVYGTPEFEQRLTELWAPDRKARRVPLFTEINEGGLPRQGA